MPNKYRVEYWCLTRDPSYPAGYKSEHENIEEYHFSTDHIVLSRQGMKVIVMKNNLIDMRITNM